MPQAAGNNSWSKKKNWASLVLLLHLTWCPARNLSQQLKLRRQLTLSQARFTDLAFDSLCPLMSPCMPHPWFPEVVFFLRVHCTKALFLELTLHSSSCKIISDIFPPYIFSQLLTMHCFIPSNVFQSKTGKKGEKSPWDNSQILFSPVSTFYSNFFFKIQQLCTYI